ncbi:bifunctional UDP-N-acetylglucosamine diphosphorylase/glucosamine-1-phosphate N-acetyltransferase GlmU [Campylobacter gracilis]|uniref:Bifunctional protein GlmU n=1 Tax=Campylobacter gracilis RM3268 TaxID=553220 RepID=C8PLE3_9BACT|nr:bifunctional UDP-N-acetylglucosamine diphosphorylase/glucosamine-1-phosphate N-acetyltransferase GlmU [Campylobacter gracilis]AKT92869.1 fused N-acetylglucosamine-1-phosphate uridyltransferase and glucosamine-1-phosphate acetyltransferase [Campylobacter gracilis]EEV16255.1 UDP-N-acetylglucosamine diphosphorylase/glucosamine-1-phosphate N-acetyltransferase [Campylobacter gracilis RM3268]UEB44962.1 bifunctional UDP-N-acetylglucosamine diphosphorylase/glucosamine-1-phosphate N-acetyltransferase 
MNDVSVIVLAAGLGTRMKSQKAKVLFELCGEPMIIHILKKAYEISNDVSVILHYQFDEVKSAVLAHFPNAKIYKQDHEHFPGTAGGLKEVEIRGGKTLIICGDMPLVKSAELRKLCEGDAEVNLSVFSARDPFGYGRVITRGGEILKIVEQKDASEEEKAVKDANAGCYCFKSEALKQILPQIKPDNAQKEYYLTDAIKIAKDMGLKCAAVWVDEQSFMGINDKFALSIAENLMQNEIKENLMKQGVLMRLPQSIYIDSRAKFIGECELQENVSIVGPCVIESSLIKSGCVIEDSVVKNSDIGPMAHLRPKCEVIGTHIGNFVELKNAKVNKIKAGHLSYLGDCEIDEGSNIGCGTITCNYDGKKKYKTIIGKNVFIGSDTQLVAPVQVADDVIIAAGTTVTSDVPSGALAISRSKQINKDGFFHKFFRSEDE